MELNDITNVGQVSVLNANFDEIEQTVNEKLIDRENVGALEDDVDMNGFRIYNLPKPVADHEPARLKDLRDAGALTGGSSTAGVSSFNLRDGDVTLTSSDVTTALGFTPPNTFSPSFTGVPTAPTAATPTSTTQVASTAFVKNAIAAAATGDTVTSFNTRTGAVSLTSGDVTTALTYTPANTASPTFTGVPTAPTATGGTNTTQLATTAFVQSAVSGSVSGVASFNTRTGAVTLGSGDVTTALGYTPVNPASAALTGSPTAPTQTGTDNSTKIATTAFVKSAITGTGVSSFNTRTGAVSLTNDDVIKSFTSSAAAKNIIWNTDIPGAVNATANSSIYLQRNASYTGGPSGVVSALYIDTFTPTGTHTSFEWGLTSALYSRSVVSGGGEGAVPQNVAINGTAFRTAGNAPIWAGNFPAYHTMGTYGSGSGEMHGIETSVGGNGVDPGEATIGMYVLPQLRSEVAGPGYFEAWTGVLVSNGTGGLSYFRNGITNQAGSVRGYFDRGTHAVAIDLASSTNTEAAIRIKAGDAIAFEGTGVMKMRYNSSNGRLEFVNGPPGSEVGRGYINMTSGTNVDLAGGAVDLSNYTTLNTTQTITGLKTFSNYINATGGIVTNGVISNGNISMGSNTVAWGGAGNVYGSAGSLSGYLRIQIDGGNYKIPFYAM
jgi:hypothetical protein